MPFLSYALCPCALLFAVAQPFCRLFMKLLVLLRAAHFSTLDMCY